LAKTLDDMIFTTAEYEPWDDDYTYLDEPDTVDSWLYQEEQDNSAERYMERLAAMDSLARLDY
jgi:hypothetical protein